MGNFISKNQYNVNINKTAQNKRESTSQKNLATSSSGFNLGFKKYDSCNDNESQSSSNFSGGFDYGLKEYDSSCNDNESQSSSNDFNNSFNSGYTCTTSTYGNFSPFDSNFNRYQQHLCAEPNPFDPEFKEQTSPNEQETRLFTSNFTRIPVNSTARTELLTKYGNHIVNNTAPFMGKLISSQNNVLGACILIGRRHVVVPAHVTPKNGDFCIKFYKKNVAFTASCILKENIALDYMIIEMTENIMPEGMKYPKFRALKDDEMLTDLLLLHYSQNGELEISGNFPAIDHPLINQTISTNHDTAVRSSGGVYIDNNGYIIAAHLGKDKLSLSSRKEGVGLTVNAMIAEVSYFAKNLYKFIDLEGFEAQKMLYQKSKKVLPSILGYTRKERGETIVTTKGAKWIKVNKPKIFKEVYYDCLGQANVHKVSHDYSLNLVIESDHLLPANVVARSINNDILPKYLDIKSDLYIGGGSRPGEYGMPAVTIPYDKHRNLLTTGKGEYERLVPTSLRSQLVNKTKFHEKLISFCNDNKAYIALLYVLQDYYENDIFKNKRCQQGVIDAIDLYCEHGVISREDAYDLIGMVKNPNTSFAKYKLIFQYNKWSLVKK